MSKDHSDSPRLVLASGSSYRAELLRRLGLEFSVLAADIDEARSADEPAADMARRLAHAKARAVAARDAGAWIIGSDQVATCAGVILGKPLTREGAADQLRQASGRSVAFHTSLCLLGPDRSIRAHVDRTDVRFRTLDGRDIAAYLDREPALDCAGSFKAEGLGISLFDAIDTRDPTALIGLPLIALCGMLREAGFRIP